MEQKAKRKSTLFFIGGISPLAQKFTKGPSMSSAEVLLVIFSNDITAPVSPIGMPGKKLTTSED